MPEARPIDRIAIMWQLQAIEQNGKLTDAQKFRLAKFAVENAHTIETQARRGWWIETKYNPVGDTMYCECNCSNCNYEITREKGQYPKFCENCGTDMREDTKCDEGD